MAIEYKLSYTASDIDKKLETIDTLGSELETKQDKLTFDTSPTYGSSNPVTSGGVYTALEDKQPVGDYALSTDIPVVYDWAKAETKPTYTASEVGALADTTEIPNGFVAQAEEPTDKSVLWVDIDDDSDETISAVSYTEQILTDEQKAQARENIGALSKNQGAENVGLLLSVGSNGDVVPTSITTTNVTQEELPISRHSSNYADETTFDFVENTGVDYNCTVISETVGGRVTISWDTAHLTQIEFIPYLFKDGVAYKYAQKSVSGSDVKSGEWNVEWIDPATGSGFCIISSPLSFDIPDGCTFYGCFRATHTNGATIVPDGSPYSVNWNDGDIWISNHLLEVISVSIEKQTQSFDVSHKLDKSQGAENANRFMITNADGVVVAGGINPRSIALRPSWDTVIHRGWISGAKENTLPAFYLAKENGYDWVECDIRVTADGIPVLAHDATITGTDGDGQSITLTVAETELSTLQSVVLESHSRFGDIKTNTLAELLNMARLLGMKILLDIKINGETAMKEIAKTVIRYAMSNNVVYMPYDIANAQYIASVDKNASFDFVCFGTTPEASVDFTSYTSLLTGANSVNFNVQVNTWSFDESVIKSINTSGCGLSVWNIWDIEHMEKAVDAGAHRITKANDADAIDFDALYLENKLFW